MQRPCRPRQRPFATCSSLSFHGAGIETREGDEVPKVRTLNGLVTITSVRPFSMRVHSYALRDSAHFDRRIGA
jgi:hypothetical protein